MKPLYILPWPNLVALTATQLTKHTSAVDRTLRKLKDGTKLAGWIDPAALTCSSFLIALLIKLNGPLEPFAVACQTDRFE